MVDLTNVKIITQKKRYSFCISINLSPKKNVITHSKFGDDLQTRIWPLFHDSILNEVYTSLQKGYNQKPQFGRNLSKKGQNSFKLLGNDIQIRTRFVFHDGIPFCKFWSWCIPSKVFERKPEVWRCTTPTPTETWSLCVNHAARATQQRL